MENFIFFSNHFKGRRQNKNATPPTHPDYSEIFESQNYLKNAAPPLGSNSGSFEFENILTAEDPLGQGYLGIFTLKWAYQVFLFISFRRGSESNL